MQIHETADSFDLPDERVWVVGDLHGNAGWIQPLLPAMRRHDPSLRTILQLGDYGFEHAQPGTGPVDYWAKRTGIERVLVTPGNHEEWNHITPAQESASGMAIRVSDVVWLIPRPFRFQIAGREVLSLGGASSVDKAFRTAGKDWFEDELITEPMEAAAIAGGPADLMLTHESPAIAVPEVQRLLTNNPHDFPPEALAVSAAQRERVQRVSDAALPRLHMHGHMHVYGKFEREDGRTVVSLDRDTFACNAGVLDLAGLAFSPLPLNEIRGGRRRYKHRADQGDGAVVRS
ncbi:metallophosphoesterase family protein [Microbacterium sp. CH1]|uniref:metallophosphoesterase family protein n=1 Tax=Microbacterium sp. CH1 TaxID=1770208 RepID=UPI000787455E|nr:metallophosphoesterase [Microbacterium sp. CH1]KYJ98121.1 hypothetical protein AUV07_12625 [Microbacterium sp. CH1]